MPVSGFARVMENLESHKLKNFIFQAWKVMKFNCRCQSKESVKTVTRNQSSPTACILVNARVCVCWNELGKKKIPLNKEGFEKF